MIVLQTNFILETLATRANTVLHSSTTGITSFYSFSLVMIMSNCLIQIVISCFKILLQLLEVRSQWNLSVGIGTSHFTRLQRVVSRERCDP